MVCKDLREIGFKNTHASLLIICVRDVAAGVEFWGSSRSLKHHLAVLVSIEAPRSPDIRDYFLDLHASHKRQFWIAAAMLLGRGDNDISAEGTLLPRVVDEELMVARRQVSRVNEQIPDSKVVV